MYPKQTISISRCEAQAMSNEKVKSLGEKRGEKKSETIQDAVKRAKQLIRNNNAENLEEPEGLASGDMKKFLNNPDKYGKVTPFQKPLNPWGLPPTCSIGGKKNRSSQPVSRGLQKPSWKS
jgi:hypothetical protein